MSEKNWIPIKEVPEDARIWSGTIVRVYESNVEDDEVDFYDYMISFIYDNNDYLQLTCISQGEGGNIVCVLQLEPNSNHSLGKELKRMMDYGDGLVFVNFNPQVTVK